MHHKYILFGTFTKKKTFNYCKNNNICRMSFLIILLRWENNLITIISSTYTSDFYRISYDELEKFEMVGIYV